MLLFIFLTLKTRIRMVDYKLRNFKNKIPTKISIPNTFKNFKLYLILKCNRSKKSQIHET